VPPNQISPTSNTILQRFEPLPNITPNVAANNSLNTEGRPTDTNQANSRFDYVASAPSTWIFRYRHTGESRSLPTNLPHMVSNSSTAANAMADFLLGYMSLSEGQVGAPIANYRTNYYGLYFQDNWKVSSRLSLNWGLRWEDQPPYYDKNDAIVNIDFRWDNSVFPTYVRAGEGDPLAGNPAFPLPSSIPYVRDGRFGR